MIVKELFMKLGIQSDSKDFKKVEGGMERITDFAKKAAVAFAAFKLGKWIKGVADQVANLGDEFDKMEQRTGVAAQTLQKLGFAADLTGANIGVVEVAIRTLQRTADEAASGVATYKDEYDRLGVSVKDSKGNLRSFEQLLPEIASGMQKLKTDTERTAIAQKIFGRSGTQLIPLLKSGSEEIQNMMKEFKELGGVIDKDLQKQSADYIDNQTRMNTVFQGLRNVIGKQLLPVFNEMSETTIEWFKQNRKWIALKLESVFKSLGKVIKNISRFFGDIIDDVIEWTKKLSPLQKGILKVSAAAAGLAILLALPAGSILLLIALIALLIDDFQTWQDGGESLIGSFIDKMEKLLGLDVIRIFKKWGSNFIDMIKRMFAPLAIFIKFIIDAFILGFPKSWERMTTRVQELWDNLIKRFWDTINSLRDGIIKIFSFIWSKVGKGTKEFLSSFWKSFVDVLDRLWTKIVNWSKKIIDKIAAPFKKIREFVSGIFGDNEVKIIQKIQDLAQAGKTLPTLQRTISEPTRRFVSPTTNSSVNVTVNASPGMNEERLAQKVSQGVKKELDRVNRATIQAFVPAGG